MSQGVVLFTANTRSRQEIQALAAEARRLRPDVKIFHPTAGELLQFPFEARFLDLGREQCSEFAVEVAIERPMLPGQLSRREQGRRDRGTALPSAG